MDLIHELARKGFHVQEFDAYHFLVNGEFDFWFNEKGNALSWWDRITDERGRKPADQLLLLIVRRFADAEHTDVPHDEFIKRLVHIGWREEDAEGAWQKRHQRRNGNG